MLPQPNPDIWLLDNPIMAYSWGSTTAIAELLGQPPDPARPQAELWVGAHPKAPSTVRGTDPPLSLAELIRQRPEDILGPAVARTFGNQLPFLLKVLAASEPLSIQVHPKSDDARRGFEAENRSGLALSDPARNFRDPNHKPECLCALTPFWGLCGFRPLEAMAVLLNNACPSLFKRLERLAGGAEDQVIRRLFAELLHLPRDGQAELIHEALSWRDQGPERRWMEGLAQRYPGDVGVLSPLLLNLCRLEPGQALFLAPGTLHAYLEGVGVEVMANSDNVIRAGLTPKHRDIEALLDVVDFHPQLPEALSPVRVSTTEAVYLTPAREFRLGKIDVAPGLDHEGPKRQGCRVLLCLRGRAQIRCAGHEPVPLVQGESALIGAAIGGCTLCGQATVYTVDVPIDETASPSISTITDDCQH